MSDIGRIRRIAFFSSSPTGEAVLDFLADTKYKPILVVTKPDATYGREKKLRENSIAISSNKLSIPVLKPERLKDQNFINSFKNSQPDIAVVISYGKIIPIEILTIPKYGFINIHPSLLPKYRGPSPIQTAILNGDEISGTTIIKLDEQMDHGPILEQKSISIDGDTTTEQLETILIKLGCKLLADYLDSMTPGIEQKHEIATYTKKFSATDGILSNNSSLDLNYNRFRALGKEPGCFIDYGDQRLRIIDCNKSEFKLSTDSIMFSSQKKLYFKCSDGYLEIKKIQKSGGRPINALDFINGYKDLPKINN